MIIGANVASRFASPSQLSMHVVASILADESFLADLLEQSQARLGIARAKTEKMLDRVGIPYHSKGSDCSAINMALLTHSSNAGLFLWLNLSSFLKPDRFAGDAWAAHRDLGKAFDLRGVDLSDGETYHSPTPGCFRMVFSVPDYFIDEGIRRSVIFIGMQMELTHEQDGRNSRDTYEQHVDRPTCISTNSHIRTVPFHRCYVHAEQKVRLVHSNIPKACLFRFRRNM